MHLVEGRAASGPAVDSARQNLASTFVNAFVNAGFGTDKLMTGVPCCKFCKLCCVLPAPSSVYRMASSLLDKSGPSDQEETLETLMQAARRRTRARCTGCLRTRPGKDRGPPLPNPRPRAGGAEEDPGAVHLIFKNKTRKRPRAAPP